MWSVKPFISNPQKIQLEIQEFWNTEIIQNISRDEIVYRVLEMSCPVKLWKEYIFRPNWSESIPLIICVKLFSSLPYFWQRHILFILLHKAVFYSPQNSWISNHASACEGGGSVVSCLETSRLYTAKQENGWCCPGAPVGFSAGSGSGTAVCESLIKPKGELCLARNYSIYQMRRFLMTFCKCR